MNKRIWMFFIVSLSVVLLLPLHVFAHAKANTSESTELSPKAHSAILMDTQTGTVIYNKKSYDKLPPASTTKIMTLLLTMEALDKGTLKLNDKVRTSQHAASMGGSQIFLEVGEEMTVNEMIKGIAMASGNDASVAIAEKIAGSEQSFVQLMNKRAEQLGMKHTHFVNCNGLPADDHYSCAHDIAVMSRELLKHPVITKYTGVYQDYLRKHTSKPFWLVNTNKLVKYYRGADGLKTGYTSMAKFCISATAHRNGMRVLAVVLGEPDVKTRNSEVSAMFDYAFNQYCIQPVYKKGDYLGTVKIEKGTTRQLPLYAKQNYSVLINKQAHHRGITHKLLLSTQPLNAPVVAGHKIGKLVIYNQGVPIKQFDLLAPYEVQRAGWWMLFKRTMSTLFDGAAT